LAVAATAPPDAPNREEVGIWSTEDACGQKMEVKKRGVF
jgi:hypothetical protein